MDAFLGQIARARRHTGIAIAITGGSLALAFGLVLALPDYSSGQWRPRIENLRPVYLDEQSRRPSISPDGSTIAYVAERKASGLFRVYTIPLRGGPPRPLPHQPAGSIEDVRWRRDGKGFLLAINANNDNRIVYQALDSPAALDLGPGRDPDDCGDAIVAIVDSSERDTGQELILQDDKTGRRQSLVTAKPDDLLDHPRCDVSGKSIVYSRRQGDRSDLFIVDRNGRTRQLTDQGDQVTPTFVPDGTSIVFSRKLPHRRVHLFEMSLADGETRQLTLGDDEGRQYYAPEVSPDGQTLVFNHEIASDGVFEGRGADRRNIRELSTQQQWLDVMLPTRDRSVIVGTRLRPDPAIVAIRTEDGQQIDLALGRAPFPSLDGRRVFFSPDDSPHELQVVPIDGGPARRVAVLPGKVIAGVDAPDGQHVEIDPVEIDPARAGGAPVGGGTQSWRIDPSRAIAFDGVEGLVIPAPDGAWRAVSRDGAVLLSAPGRDSRSLRCQDRPTWVDARRFGCAIDDSTIALVDVETGARREIDLPWLASRIMLADDGDRWIATRVVIRVTRHAITNFADRPWAR